MQSLWNVEKLLYQMLEELTKMEKAILEEFPHSPGWINTFEKKEEPGIPQYRWLFFKNGKRESRKLEESQLDSCQKYIDILKARRTELEATKVELEKLHLCFEALNIIPSNEKDADKILKLMKERQEKQKAESYRPEDLKHLTMRGELVRSKSEVMLANLFYVYHIQYEYEKVIKLDGYRLLPDFTITRADGAIFYWEHLGMLETPAYAKRWAQKSQAYTKAGLGEGNGLIITRDRNGIFDEQDALLKINAYHLGNKRE